MKKFVEMFVKVVSSVAFAYVALAIVTALNSGRGINLNVVKAAIDNWMNSTVSIKQVFYNFTEVAIAIGFYGLISVISDKIKSKRVETIPCQKAEDLI